MGANSAWAVDVPTPVYFNNFTSTSGLTIKGGGSYTVDSDPRFGNVFSNAASSSPRSNYLILPTTVFKDFTADGGKTAMTISFWVNAKNAGGASSYTYAPLFAAYSAAPTDVVDAETSEVTGTSNTLPMICLQSRGLIQINNAGWCDFGPALNKDGKNNVYNTSAWEASNESYVSGGNWLDDNKWHLYTLTLTATQTTVYLDGVLKNQWNLDGTTDGQIISGMFTASATNLTYVCLGGNQAWNLGDNDAAFMFDDFAVYDVALSAEQIAQIMTDKTTATDITSLTANYTFDATSNINPFDNGAIWQGTNVNAFLPSTSTSTRGLTATAYFDSDTETSGRQAFTIASGDVVTISMVMYNGYNVSQNTNNTAFSVYNSDGTVLVSFTYNSSSCNFSSVSFGGTTTIDGFEAFSGQSAYNTTQGANGINDGSKPFVTTSGYNPVVTISIAGDGNVSINFVRSKTSSYDKTFSAKLSDVKMDLSKIVMASTDYGKSGNNMGQRISGIGYMNFGLKHTVTVKAVDGSSNELATISTHSVDDGTTLRYAYPRYVLNGTTVYMKGKQTNNEYRITSDAITATQDITVEYSQYANDGYFYTEAEALDGVTVATNSGASTRTSMAGEAYGTDIAVTTLPAGTYKATIGWYGKDKETCTIKAGDATVVSATQTGSWGETIGDTFTLTESTAVTMTASGNNYTGIDYILIEKTGVSASLGTNGYATFASPYALDLTTANLPTDVTAYKAAVDGTTVTFTAFDQTVPANTGMLLKGTASTTVNIPVAVSGSEVSGNAFLVNEGGATFTGDDSYYYFGLKANTLTFGLFDPSSVAIPANKAYLKVLKSSLSGSEARLNVMFDDEATGISTIENAAKADGYYNLSGQRVAKPSKGLYIVNGKKVIIK